MTLQRPELLLIGPSAALALSLVLTLQWRRLVRLARAYPHAAQQRLTARDLQRFPTLRMLFLVVASFSLAVAAANPRSDTPDPAPAQPQQPLDIALAVDLSRSMAAEDLGTSRIVRVRDVVVRLSETLPAARIVLVVFADWPYTLVPPTDDPSIVQYFAHSLSADLVLDRDQGTSFTSALAHAREALAARARPGARRAVLILSDGGVHEPLEDVLAAARSSADDAPIWTGGVGTRAGAPFPVPPASRTDEVGGPVVSRLEDDVLRGIAQAGGGEYHDVSTDRGLAALTEGLGAIRDESSPDQEPVDAAFWLTVATLPLLLVEGWLDAGRRLARPRDRELEA